jgi:hypothetical protein
VDRGKKALADGASMGRFAGMLALWSCGV